MTVTELKDTNFYVYYVIHMDVEDVYHFVLICPIYLYFRNRFIISYFFNVPSVHKSYIFTMNWSYL